MQVAPTGIGEIAIAKTTLTSDGGDCDECREHDFIGWEPFGDVVGTTGKIGRYLTVEQIVGTTKPVKTPAEQAGWKVNDLGKVCSEHEQAFSYGAIVALDADDGTEAPLFRLVSGHCALNIPSGGIPGAFVDLSEVQRIENDESEPDYRNGDWWPWTGGECPVEANDIVNFLMRGDTEEDDDLYTNCRADGIMWTHNDSDGDIIAFRVVQHTPSERERLIEQVTREIERNEPPALDADDIARILHDAGYIKDPDE